MALCVESFGWLGHCCTQRGELQMNQEWDAIRNWGPCKTLSEVRAFLGTVGVMRIFIRNSHTGRIT